MKPNQFVRLPPHRNVNYPVRYNLAKVNSRSKENKDERCEDLRSAITITGIPTPIAMSIQSALRRCIHTERVDDRGNRTV